MADGKRCIISSQTRNGREVGINKPKIQLTTKRFRPVKETADI